MNRLYKLFRLGEAKFSFELDALISKYSIKNTIKGILVDLGYDFNNYWTSEDKNFTHDGISKIILGENDHDFLV